MAASRRPVAAACLFAGLLAATGGLPARAATPSIAESIAPTDWLVVGPFARGSRESGIDNLWEAGGAANIRPAAGIRHTSILGDGGWVEWRPVTAQTGQIEFKFDGVNWQMLEGQFGFAGSQWAAYAATTLPSPRPLRGFAIAEGVNRFWINGRPGIGDPYAHGFLRIPVTLDAGPNTIVLEVGGSGATDTARFELQPATPDAVILESDILAPSLRRGLPLDAWLGVPVVNATTETLSKLRIQVRAPGVLEDTEAEPPAIAPGCVFKVAVPLRTANGIDWSKVGDQVPVTITLTGPGVLVTTHSTLTVRNPDQSYTVSFRSAIDESVQYYAVLPPKDFDPARKYALLLTLHGAGVEAIGQVNAYSQKDWAFVVAPTNRRPYGFDWQDWGHLDALEVLDLALRTFPIDPNRVYLTGHSMGGHGTWHIGITHPDRFAAIAPSAGWASFDTYVPFTLRRNALLAGGPLARVWDRAFRADRPLHFLENARNLPVFVLQGGADDNVPAVQARLLVERLRQLRYSVEYLEVPGQGHWWDGDAAPGVDCLEHPDLIVFLQHAKRDPLPRRINFRTADLGVEHRAYWVDILEPRSPLDDVAVDALYEPAVQTIRVDTENVGVLRIDLSNFPPGAYHLIVDDRVVALDAAAPGVITAAWSGGRFRPITAPADGRKTPAAGGPIKAAFYRPFVIVYGAGGTALDTQRNLEQARLLVWQWYLRGNGQAVVLRDSEATDTLLRTENVILIGLPGNNAVLDRWQARLPFRITHGLLSFTLERPDRVAGQANGAFALQYIYPNPLNPDRLALICTATTGEAIPWLAWQPVLYSGSALPDYIVYDAAVQTAGFAGLRMAGYFDVDWTLNPDDGYGLAP